jgi:hypothetical protein
MRKVGYEAKVMNFGKLNNRQANDWDLPVRIWGWQSPLHKHQVPLTVTCPFFWQRGSEVPGILSNAEKLEAS